MITLDHFAEPRAAHGGLAGEGALNLLGRPDLDRYVVLVREAVQNSWDARSGRVPVTVSVKLNHLSTEQRAALGDEVFAQLPPKGVFGGALEGTEAELSNVLRRADLQILSITDRGTTGLGGPLRADRPPDTDAITDFVDLVFNIGQPSDKDLGGGTYGFGKTISYLVSDCRTVIIHTSTEHKGRIQQRLIAQTIGRQYAYKQRNYTGRHWWGARKNGEAIEPLTGDSARRLAARIGLPAFSGTETGTTIAILAPDLGDQTANQVANYIAEALAWNFWPKMIGSGGAQPDMRFDVSVDGREVDVPDPRCTPPLSAFAGALDAVRSCDSRGAPVKEFPLHHIQHVRSQRPIADLGWLAMGAVPVEQRTATDCGLDDHGQPRTAAAFTGPAHHVAVMRRAELVVQYRPGPVLANKALEWAGVFRTSEEVDGAFAAAEPPTHDDWRPNLVSEKRQRTYVNVALREIKSSAESAFAPVVRPGVETASASGVVIADQLGDLLSVVSGNGPSKPVPRPRGHRTAGSPTAKVDVGRRWLEAGPAGETHLCIEFSVIAKGGSEATAVHAVVGAAGPDGSSMEKEAPVGAPIPSILGYWRGSQRIADDVLEVRAGDRARWCLRVLQPPDVGTVVNLKADPLDGAA
ncbi:hypothetical protein [Blastococcus sp. SYSU DS0533]